MKPYNDIWYQSHDGHRLYARDYWDQKSEDTLVCIPGLTRNAADFSLFCEYASSQFRVIVVDLRGRGNSAYDPEPINYRPENYIQDVLSLIESLKLESLVLLGTSLGGIVSMLMAPMLGERLRGVVLNDIGPDIEVGGVERIRGYVSDAKPAENWAQAIERTRNLHGRFFPDMDDAEWEHFTRNIYREDDRGRPVHNYDPNIAMPFVSASSDAPPPDLWPAFQGLSEVPTLVLRGEYSDILSTEGVRKMVALKPDLQTVEVPRVGHAPTLAETDAQRAIEQFLKSLHSR